MKLKAVLKDECSPEMKAAIKSPEFKRRVINEILVRHLHMSPDIGPAEFYIQKSDFSEGDDRHMCEVRLTGVSTNKNRATNDFYRARHALERMYAQVLHPFLEPGERLQLMVSLMLDQPPYGEASSLLERKGKPALWIEGGVPLPQDLDD